MDMKDGIKERLLMFIASMKMRKSEFERRCELSNGYINSIKGDIGVLKLTRMVYTFPQLNPFWVATGKGDMYRPVVKDMTPLGGDFRVESFLIPSPEDEVTHEKDEKYQVLLNLLTQIQKRDEINQETIRKLQEGIMMKEEQINRLLNLVDKLNYNLEQKKEDK